MSFVIIVITITFPVQSVYMYRCTYSASLRLTQSVQVVVLSLLGRSAVVDFRFPISLMYLVSPCMNGLYRSISENDGILDRGSAGIFLVEHHVAHNLLGVGDGARVVDPGTLLVPLL